MADLKISALTGASTPLAGTEVLPIVQSGATVKVSVANLTAGRAVSVSSLTNSSLTSGRITYATTAGLLTDSSGLTYGVDNVTLSYGGATRVQVVNSSASNNVLMVANTSAAQLNSANGYQWEIQTAGSTKLTVANSNDVTVDLGNLVIGTSGKGIDFSATSGTGTSELLADYEEGTWTPTQGAGLVVVGAFSSSGTYTKVGRQVTVRGNLTGATSIASLAGNVITAGLPFTPASASNGAASNAFAGSASVCLLSGNDIYSISAIANGGGVIYFAMTYFV